MLSCIHLSIQVIRTSEEVIVDTPLTQYTITGVSLNGVYRRYLDSSVRIKKLEEYHQFSGVPGHTVSTKTPYLVGKRDLEDMKKKFEMKMRELYIVPTLFPSIALLLKSEKFMTPDVPVN